MSLPRAVIPPPTHSRSPSKSSLRSVGGTKPGPRHSPRFEEPLLQPSASESQTLENEQAVIEDESTQIEPLPPPFQPLFTLIEDSVTNEHFHPTVHYIFADDDGDIITEAACRSLAPDGTTLKESRLRREEESRLPPEVDGVKEHYLIFDVQPSATLASASAPPCQTQSLEIMAAYSLSSDWQITSTLITNAPTIDAGDTNAEGEDDGLMLKIEGRGTTPPDAEEKGQGKGKGKESLEEMVERFQRRLADIKRTMEAATPIGMVGNVEEPALEAEPGFG